MEAAGPNTPAHSEPIAVFKKRGPKGKANLRKRPSTPPPPCHSDYDSDADSDSSSSRNAEASQRVKRRKKTGITAVTSADAPRNKETDLSTTVYTANRDAPITDTNDATKQSNWYDQGDQVSKSPGNLLGSTRQAAKSAQSDGAYKGLANTKPKTTVGPIQAPTNIRTITVTDFAPDVCKDYKQTGFCGFGDNCKFLHSREDYKQGWQLDREWENVSKGRPKMGGTVVASVSRNKPQDDDDDDDEAILDNIPFVCIICRESYKEPIVTRCGHYFCEACALKRYRRDPTCAACGSSTSGVFNTAKRLQRLLDRKRERAAKRRQEAIEAGEAVSDEDDESKD